MRGISPLFFSSLGVIMMVYEYYVAGVVVMGVLAIFFAD